MHKHTTPPTRTRRRPYGPTEEIVRVRGPADVLAVVPYLLGFEPASSIVVVSLLKDRRRFGPVLRADLLPADDVGSLADYLEVHVAEHRMRHVMLLAYADESCVADADAIVEAMMRRLAVRDTAVVEAFRAGDGRWWSYTCTAETCCPAEGTAYDPTSTAGAAQMVAAGLGKVASRDALRSLVAPADHEVRAAVDTLHVAWAADHGRADPDVLADQLRQRVVRSLRRELELQEVAELLGYVQTITARDAAWTMMSHRNAAGHLRVWRQVMRMAPDRLLPPAGSLAAFAAWLSGRGTLASHALDRVTDVDPSYSMAVVVRALILSGSDPRQLPW